MFRLLFPPFCWSTAVYYRRYREFRRVKCTGNDVMALLRSASFIQVLPTTTTEEEIIKTSYYYFVHHTAAFSFMSGGGKLG